SAAGDARGAAAAQSFDLPVVSTAPNNSPSITSSPRFTIRIGDTYLYQVEADDPNGDALAYSLSTGPAGMTIDANGLVTWVPVAAQVGPNAVQIRVEDGRGGFATPSRTLSVVAQTTNPSPTSTSNPPFPRTGHRPHSV